MDIKNPNPYKIYVKKYKEYIIKTNPIDTKKNSCTLLSYVIFSLYKALDYKDYNTNLCRYY